MSEQVENDFNSTNERTEEFDIKTEDVQNVKFSKIAKNSIFVPSNLLKNVSNENVSF